MNEFQRQIVTLKEKYVHLGTAADIAYSTIRDAIRTRLIRPGERVIEVDLAEALEISRTPLREALHRLENEHLLEKVSRRGLIVPEIKLNDLIEIFEIREVLDGLAARRAAQRMGPIELDTLRDLVEQMKTTLEAGDIKALSDVSAQFHRMINTGSKLSRLQHMLALLNDTYSYSLELFEFAGDRAAGAVAEHEAIYQALAAHDAEKAETLLREHARNAARAQIRARNLSE